MTFDPAFGASERAEDARTRTPRLAGVFTDLVTPFQDDRLDEDAFVALLERQIAAGAQGVVVASGVAGERATLRDGEAARLIELAVKAASGRVTVVADAASNSTASTLALVQEARDLGADAALVAAPWYNRPSQDGVVRHYQAIAAAGALPVLVWDCPARTSLALSLSTVERLTELPGVVGMVDATGDMSRASAIRRMRPEWILLSGHDASTLGYLAQGGDGCVSLAANVSPQAVCVIDAACAMQDWRVARRTHDGLADLDELLALDPVPSAAKLALSMQGLCQAEVRLPITPCPDAVKARLKRAMRSLPPSN